MIKSRFFIPIGFKLTGMVSLILGVSLAGLTIVSTLYFSAEIERTLLTNTQDRVELLSDKIETDLMNEMNAARLIAATLQGGLVYGGTGVAPTEELLAQNPVIRAVHILVRKDGNVEESAVAGESRIDDISSFAARENVALLSAFANQPAILNASPESGEPALAILFPYQLLSDTEADSVVLAELDGEPFILAVAARELYVNSIVDASGNLVVHVDRELMMTRPNLSGDALVKDAMKGETTLKQMTFEDSAGTESIGSWKRFFDGQLVAVSTVRKETAMAGAYAMQRRNSLITILILCASMLLLFLFSKTLTTPIQSLMAGALKIGEGDFSVRVGVKTSDEIGRLSDTFNTMTKGLEERDKIKSAFGKFVNKEVAERVIRGEVQLGGESRTAAIFFSDIRSFTAISERLTPHEVVEFLNEYMTAMVACVNRTHGVVDKYIGDAIMAEWGVPYSTGNDTENAVNAALLMRKALAEFNRGRGGEKKPIIRIGSGINTGEVIAGQIGSLERMEYTCIGDAVNLASRIESLNKVFKTDILISEHSWSLVKDAFRVEPMKKILVKGKAEPQQIYAVLGRLDDPGSYRNVHELREHLGYEDVDLATVNANAEEKKYEIVE